jgi:hypothetical protein
MAVVEMTAADKHSVLSGRKGPEYVGRIDSAGTHHPYHPDIRGVLEPGYTGKVRTCIATPVAEKS